MTKKNNPLSIISPHSSLAVDHESAITSKGQESLNVSTGSNESGTESTSAHYMALLPSSGHAITRRDLLFLLLLRSFFREYKLRKHRRSNQNSLRNPNNISGDI